MAQVTHPGQTRGPPAMLVLTTMNSLPGGKEPSGLSCSPCPRAPLYLLREWGDPHKARLPGRKALRAPVSFGPGPRLPSTSGRASSHPGGHAEGHRPESVTVVISWSQRGMWREGGQEEPFHLTSQATGLTRECCGRQPLRWATGACLLVPTSSCRQHSASCLHVCAEPSDCLLMK